jgi:hypothetical protein
LSHSPPSSPIGSTGSSGIFKATSGIRSSQSGSTSLKTLLGTEHRSKNSS